MTKLQELAAKAQVMYNSLNKHKMKLLQESTAPNKFSQNRFIKKVENDISGLTYIKENIDPKLFEEILPLIKEAYNLLEEIGLETNIAIHESTIESKLTSQSLHDKQVKFKTILESYINVNYVNPINKNELITENEDLIKRYVTIFVDRGESDKVNSVQYAIFERKVADFVFQYIVPKLIQKYIDKKIEETPADYFETFENTFDEKYQKIKDLSDQIAAKIAPVLFKHIENMNSDSEIDGDISSVNKCVIMPGAGRIIRRLEVTD